MNRRQFLGTAFAGALAGLAGCGSLGTDPPVANDSVTPVDVETTTARGDRIESIGTADLPVPLARMNRALPPDGLLAIEEPAFGPDWSDLELTVGSGERERTIRPRLTEDDIVVGVTRGGESRAYPLRVLNWHEVVNDWFGDEPLLVTYCPLCGSGMTAVRRVQGQETVFGVTGLLWRDNLVMYDRLTRSLWSQVSATAIHGPEWGRRLELVPSTLTTWGAWRADHPGSTVLLPPPHSRTVYQALVDQYEIDTSRDYTKDPYGTSLEQARDGEGAAHPLGLVIGVAANGEAKAYPFSALPEDGLVNDTVGGLPVVVASQPPATLVAYSRRLDGTRYQFERVDTDRMRAAETTWEIASGRGVRGPHEGVTLEPANTLRPLYLQAWREYHPDTAVFGES
jgi:hypothetical protein